MIVKMKMERMEPDKLIRNAMKMPWFFYPMQLLIQGQWWSYLSTQVLQVEQWRERGVLTVSHLGHRWIGSTIYISFKKST